MIIPLSHILPFIMEVNANMLNTIFPIQEPVTTEATATRKVALHREVRAPLIVDPRNMLMKVAEMLREVILSIEQPADPAT
jgi:hypothetical protein